MNKMNKKGFTLIEMLVVIAIIAILVAIIIPIVGSSTDKAKAAADAANLRSLKAEATTDYLTGKDDTKGSVKMTKATSGASTTYTFECLDTNIKKSKTDGGDVSINLVDGDIVVKYGDNKISYYAGLAGNK